MYEQYLQFKGTWRTYQQRVLNRFEKYKEDGKIHIVAAPGSGKTTLGIELIKRLENPALIFVPTITIREQWAKRIEEAFLKEGLTIDELVSQDLKNMKLITISTYQALHSAMTKYKGQLKNESEDDDFIQTEEVNFSDFDFLKEVQRAQVQTLCLDECHHLKNEWWKALEDFKKANTLSYTIALTATPPYDSQYTMWQRYIDMCGEIDEEITVPELVKEGSLCPHQDYVYFNYPTREEKKEITKFKENSSQIVNMYLQDEQFCNAVRSHPYLYTQANIEDILDHPALLSSMLIYLHEKGLTYSQYYQQILGYQKLEPMNEKWMEILLQGMLYDDPQSFVMDQSYRESIIKNLKSRGLIERRKVTLQVNTSIEKMLVKSAGKCDSIKDIVFHEYHCLGDHLKLLILTDYIRKEYEQALGDESMSVYNLGVLPFFEMIRRETVHQNLHLRIGVLCGSMMIIPAEAKERLNSICKDQIIYEKVGHLDDFDYVKIKVDSRQHVMVNAISRLFEEGYMQVLIGTKSLLGEGWDSPCVNTLILASFVGSFVLSNQMRGRAIRTYSQDPQKTSHIWHLVCMNPQLEIPELSEDYQTLERRMEHFLGIHYQENTIETGMNRLTAIHHPLTKHRMKKTNRDMLDMSRDRSQLKKRWDESLAIINKMEVVEENAVNESLISMVLLHDAIRQYVFQIIFNVLAVGIGLLIFPSGMFHLIYNCLILLVFLAESVLGIQKIFNYRTPLGRLEVFGQGIYEALRKKGLLESDDSVVKVEDDAMNHIVYLAGGTGHDKALFSRCVYEFFDEIDNQRYILYHPRKRKTVHGYFVIPEIFSKRKEDALLFVECLRPFVGRYELVYTRNIEGRQILLEGRIHALSNKEMRCLTKKKVKGALE